MRYLIVVSLLALVQTASADVIRAPADCSERGWYGKRAGHSLRCTPRPCQNDADCLGGGSCEQVDRCYSDDTYSMGRRRPDPDQPRPTEPRANARCQEGVCPGEQRCERANNECVYPEGTSFAAGRLDQAPQRVAVAEQEPEPQPQPRAEPVTPAQPATQTTPANETTPANDTSGTCATASAGVGSSLVLLALLSVRRRQR